MKGTVKQASTKEYNGKTYHSFLMDEVWYGTGLKKLADKGDTVQFDAEQNDKGFWQAKNVVKVAAAPAGGTSTTGATGSGATTDWARKDAMISWQAARNSANNIVGLAVQTGLEGAPDSYTKLVAESNRLTKLFYDSTVNLGASAGSSTAPAKPKEVEPEFSDPMPF